MQLITIDSSRTASIFKMNDTMCLNLNALIRKSTITSSIFGSIQETIKHLQKINICNLSSLCYKIKVDYASFDCLNMIEDIVKTIKMLNPNIQLTQCGVLANLEEDAKPFEALYKIDTNNNVIYISKILKSELRFLGFTDSQIANIFNKINSIDKYIPKDLTQNVYTIQSEKAMQTYEYIKEILN